MICFACLKCQEILGAEDNMRGVKVACYSCGTRMLVPLDDRSLAILLPPKNQSVPAPSSSAEQQATIQSLIKEVNEIRRKYDIELNTREKIAAENKGKDEECEMLKAKLAGLTESIEIQEKKYQDEKKSVWRLENALKEANKANEKLTHDYNNLQQDFIILEKEHSEFIEATNKESNELCQADKEYEKLKAENKSLTDKLELAVKKNDKLDDSLLSTELTLAEAQNSKEQLMRDYEDLQQRVKILEKEHSGPIESPEEGIDKPQRKSAKLPSIKEKITAANKEIKAKLEAPKTDIENIAGSATGTVISNELKLPRLHGREKQENPNLQPDINIVFIPPSMQKSEHNITDTVLDTHVDSKKLSDSTDNNTLGIYKTPNEEVIQPTQETLNTNINSSSIVITIDDISSISLPSDAHVSATPSPVKPPQRSLSPRMRRLVNDADLIQRRLVNFKLVKVKDLRGSPPDVYIIEYFVKGIEMVVDGNIKYRNSHLTEFKLTSDYPRMSPKCRMLTPIFHPNIEPAVICIGDHWTAQESLLDLVIRVGEIITYQSYNVKSPLDGEAAMWADLNKNIFPVDGRDLTPPE